VVIAFKERYRSMGGRRIQLSNKWTQTLLHAAAWGALIGVPFLFTPPPLPIDDFQPTQWVLLPANLMLIFCFYFNALVLVPRVLYRYGSRAYGLAAIAGVALGATLLFFIVQFVQEIRGLPPFIRLPFVPFPVLFVGALSLAWRLVHDQSRSEESRQRRETENLRNELAFLRSQISPHFLFNVLNSTVALARKRSDRLEPALLRLSSLLRYMLYESDDDRVGLDREIEYLRAYIDLQLLRFGDSVTVTLDAPAPDVLAAHTIEPMLLIPFLENAFKHGVGFVTNPVIGARLRIESSMLIFEVRNPYIATSSPPDSLEKNSGIGLANVTRRLHLLYAHTHALQACPSADGQWYEVHLRLPLR
jgi:two-component system, LytTR family, sensor kinase